MTVAIVEGRIDLSGECGVDEAETLLQALLNRPQAAVNWSACETAHTAIIQVLLIAKVSPLGIPASAFLRDRIGPLLRR